MTCLFRFEALQREPFDEKALKYSTNNDPIGLLKSCRKRHGDLKTGTRRLNWQLWVACYAGAHGIRQQPDLFDKLLADDYFDQRSYKSSIHDILRFAMLIGTDADTGGPTYKKACSIASRLQPLFDEKVEPMEVLKRIEAAGGLNRLKCSDVMATEEDGADTDNDKVCDDEDGDSDNEASYDEGDEELQGGDEPAASLTTARSPARSGPSGRRTTPPRSTKAREGQKAVKQATAQSKQAIHTSDHVTREVGDGLVILEVEVTQMMLSSVLNAASSFIHVKCAAPVDGWKRVVCVTVASSD